MPEQKLVANSTLLSQHGWLKVCEHAHECVATGVDRSGRLSNQIVKARLVGETKSFAFVGTKRAFGPFHPGTRLIDADGNVRSVAEIVLENLIGALRFENVTGVDGLVFEERDALRLWSEIRAKALIETEEHLVFLAAGTSALLTAKRDWCSVSGPSPSVYGDGMQPAYLRIGKAEFLEAITEKPSDRLQELISLVFPTTEEGAIVIDRDDFIWCLWSLLFSDQRKGGEIELIFDSLQHSTTVAISPKTSKSSFILSRGATAFFRNQDAGIFEVSWDDSSWSPISSGFILPAT